MALDKEKLKSDLTTAIKGINPLTDDTIAKVAEAIANKIDEYIKGAEISVTVPSMAVSNNSTPEITVAGTIA